MLFHRAVYRLIELSDGWHGRIISNELYFSKFILELLHPIKHILKHGLDVLDATMIVIVMFIMIIIHPGRFLSEFDVLEQHPMKARGRV